MAEATTTPTGSPGGRQVIIIATIAIVVIFSVFLVALRACSSVSTVKPGAANVPSAPVPPKQNSSEVVIYSNMDLKDAAAVITRLKELKISYQIKDEGRSIAVPRGKADEARLGLAEKNLPAGGSVGWEIFDQSKLGATDFDRRIQFIRAISGELSRTINRISSVMDARVQIVIPETQLFQATTSPVTASVLLKLNPGETLTPMQVNAIVYLVSGSVENLHRDNVTIVDTDGNILAGGGFTPVTETPAPQPQAVAVRTEIPTEQATTASPVVQKPEQVVIEKPEEKAALEVQAKLDLEDKLTSKVQSILNKLYPPNVTIAKVNVDSIINRKTTVIILVDKTFKIEQSIKKTTFDTISAAVEYDKKRGDKIIMKSVKFRVVASAATPASIPSSGLLSKAGLKSVLKSIAKRSAYIIITLVAIVLALFFLTRRRPTEKVPGGAGVEEVPAQAPGTEGAAVETGAEEVPVVEEMKNLAAQNPAQVAELIKTWLAEEGA